MPARLQALLYQLDMDESPTYHVRKVAQPDYDEWCSVVSIYHDNRLLSTHAGQAFRYTRAEAIADAAWEAMTSLCHRHRRRLREPATSSTPIARVALEILCLSSATSYLS